MQEDSLRATSWLRSVATSARSSQLTCIHVYPAYGLYRVDRRNFGRAGDSLKVVS